MTTRTVRFTNPYLACRACGQRVHAWRLPQRQALPCGHHGLLRTLCLTYSPVGGCGCPPGTHGRPREEV